MTDIRYNNYKWLEYNRWSTASEVDKLVSHLVDGMKVMKKNGYKANMKVLVVDLYQSYLTDQEQYLACNRNKNFYRKIGNGNPYIKAEHITDTYFLGCMDYLHANGYIERDKGGQFYNEELEQFFSFVTRIRPLDKFKGLLDEYGITPDMITKFKQSELIRLKGEKVEHKYTYKGKEKTKWIKLPMDCPDTEETRRMRHVVEQYNNLLERTKIDVDIECLTTEDRQELIDRLSRMETDDKRFILRLADKEVYRVFNNGSLEQGGRFYGAWWIGAPGIVRKYITINGKPTRELDYSGIHIHLLYALKGINYADMKQDAYTLDDDIPDRDLNKLILLTAFNADGEHEAASSVFDELRLDGLLGHYNLNSHDPIRAKLNLLKEKHEPIADMIATNYGAKLQYYDSCVIEALIEHFTARRIPILTVHDSIICQVGHSDIVKDKMWDLYSKTVKALLDCNVEYTSFNPQAGQILNLLNKTTKYKSTYRLISSLVNSSGVRYSGRVPVVDNSIINIKTDQRANECSGKCNHHTRMSNNTKWQATIKIELEQHPESYTNTLVIR